MPEKLRPGGPQDDRYGLAVGRRRSYKYERRAKSTFGPECCSLRLAWVHGPLRACQSDGARPAGMSGIETLARRLLSAQPSLHAYHSLTSLMMA